MKRNLKPNLSGNSFDPDKVWNRLFKLRKGMKVKVRREGIPNSIWCYRGWVGILIAKTKSSNGFVYWAILFKKKDNPQLFGDEDMLTLKEKHLVAI